MTKDTFRNPLTADFLYKNRVSGCSSAGSERQLSKPCNKRSYQWLLTVVRACFNINTAIFAFPGISQPFMPKRLNISRSIATILVALLVVVLGSCQSQQSLRHSLGMATTAPALHKGKAVSPTHCAAEQQQPTSSASPQAAVPAVLHLIFRKSKRSFFAQAISFPLARQDLPAAASLPFYILFKRWKLHVQLP